MPDYEPMRGRGRLRRGLFGLLILLLLSSCRVDTNVDIVVDQHGAGTITLTANADADVVASAPNLATDLRFDDARAAGWTVTGPTALDSGGLVVIVGHTFTSLDEANTLLGELNSVDGPLHFENGAFTAKQAYGRSTVSFKGAILLTNSTRAFSDAALTAALGAPPYQAALTDRNLTLGNAFGLTVSLTLPGSTSPAVWSGDFDGAGATSPGVIMTAQTVYGKDNRGATLLHNVLPWAGAAWAVLFFVVIVPAIILFRRRRRIDRELEL